VKAIRLHFSISRAALTKLAARVSADAYWGPLALLKYEDIPEPRLRGSRWVRIATRLSGICASDMHAIRLEGSLDSPLTPFVSFPMVLGHEIVGTVTEVGSAVERVRVGDLVTVNPLLSCTPRGIDPPCPSCRQGEFSLCYNFARGELPPGLLISGISALNGGFAPALTVHEAQCIPVPAGVDADAAVLTDPIAVTLRAILRNPPAPGDTCLVVGCGILGLGGILCLRALHPEARVIAVAKHPFQQQAARRCGAHEVISPRPEHEFFERIAALTGGTLYRGYTGPPILVGGVQRIYDCIGSAATIETGLRVAECGGRVVVIGVDLPKRFEWSPLWFREVALVGSMGVGMETQGGVRRHTYEIYLDLVRDGRIDVTGLLTHRFPLDGYVEALRACSGRGTSHAIKVAFEFRDQAPP
jgi:threonine dehydrogenase-like Zn-dependent dehydrogenase